MRRSTRSSMRSSLTSNKKNAHSPLGPSGSKRWLLCRASPGFIARNADRLPQDDSAGSRYAIEGTAAHLYGARLLNGEKKVPTPFYPEMDANIRDGYVRFCRTEALTVLNKDPDALVLVEKTIPLFYDPDQKGTADHSVIGRRRAVFNDLKYGEGVSVEAKFNSQLAIYAESMIQQYQPKMKDDAEVVMSIYQPRAKDNRIVRRWQITRLMLKEFCRDIEKTAKSILEDPDNQPFHADEEDTCRWCPAKGICSAYAAHLLGDVPAPVAKQLSVPERRLGLPEPDSLTDSQQLKLLLVKDQLVDWLDQIEKLVVIGMQKGKRYDGRLKLVARKTNREWKDPVEAARVLRTVLDAKQVYSTKLITPAQAEKLLKPFLEELGPRFYNRVRKLVNKPEGLPTVALKDDPRPPIDNADPVSELL